MFFNKILKNFQKFITKCLTLQYFSSILVLIKKDRDKGINFYQGQFNKEVFVYA